MYRLGADGGVNPDWLLQMAFPLQQINCQALYMKKGLKMQLADVRVMLAMWVSGEWDH